MKKVKFLLSAILISAIVFLPSCALTQDVDELDVTELEDQPTDSDIDTTGGGGSPPPGGS